MVFVAVVPGLGGRIKPGLGQARRMCGGNWQCLAELAGVIGEALGASKFGKTHSQSLNRTAR